MPLPGEELPSTTLNKKRILEIITEPMCIRDISERLDLHKESVRHYLSLLENEKRVRRLGTKQFNNVRAVTFYKAIPQHLIIEEANLEEHYHPMARKVLSKDLEKKIRETEKLAAPLKRSAWIGTTLGTMAF